MMSDIVGRKALAASGKSKPGAGMLAGEESSGTTRCLYEGLLLLTSSY
jgi:hypothetical protein